MRAFLTVAAACAAVASLPSPGQVIHQHELTVATNPSLAMENEDVDLTISRMNALMGSTSYPSWDVACSNVRFVRKGDVIKDTRLHAAGTYPQLQRELARYVPMANVLLVGGINCGDTVLAAGCGDIGREPLIAAVHSSYDDQLWVHERGHNVGLKHSAERPAVDVAVVPNIGMNVMFWKLGQGHTGKDADECRQFAAANFTSVVPVGGQTPDGSTLHSPVRAQHLAQMTTQTAKPFDAPKLPPPMDVPDHGVLTTEAYRVVAIPWVDGVPFAEIRNLKTPDVDSIRQLLQGEISEFWAQAISALAVVGKGEDLTLIRRPLAMPMPQVTTGSTMQDRRKVRALVRAKLSAPVAIGLWANRFKSDSAVEALENVANVDGARASIGEPAAESLSKQALTGLSVANTARAQGYLDQVLKAQAMKDGQKSRWPSLTIEEGKLLKSDRYIKGMGLETFNKGVD